ncbi:DUF1345 domain-containing protein [Oryzihumus sp.]|uniref:DUF1345 domain-containing protein n=1 Tax=Oryzihumus sp. TaxID=1968903 RepID=UPI002ED9586A
MSEMPANNLYHRWLGWHALEMRRAVTVAAFGLIVAFVLLLFVPWSLALIGGWDAVAFAFLITTWQIIGRADGARARWLATREDPTRASSTVLLVSASVASLLGVGLAIHLAGQERGALQVVLIGAAVLTVVLSWTLANTVFTLRYAHLHFTTTVPGIGFGDMDEQERPGYRDFAYVAFTIGMCYQVSDTTLRHTGIRRTALSHALLSYLFGVVIVAGSVNLISGLIR